MATVQDIITRSLRRAGITRIGESPQARLSVEALAVLNDMLYSMETESVNMHLNDYRSAEFALTDTFYFWVPPADLLQMTVDNWDYQGTWDASTNTPALSSGSGTDGYAYRVSVAGTTALDGYDDWQVNDFLMFGEPRADAAGPYASNSRGWHRSIRTRRFEDGISAMLASRLTEELGHEFSESLIYRSKKARQQLHNAFAKPKEKNLFDTGLVYTPTWARFNTDEAI
jgi:hypothetical protein